VSLAQAFRRQAEACAELGSPFMARLMTLAAERLGPEGPVGARLHAWPGEIGPSGASLPLRFAGALHAQALGGDPALAPVYPPAEADDETLWAAVEAALLTRSDDILRWLESPPQTNEVRRSAALIAAAHWLAARHPLPFQLSELGASAGLNLMFDRFALLAGASRLGPEVAALSLAPDWRGKPPPRPATLAVAERRGVDLNPLDSADPAHRLRLRAYLWADQTGRRALTDAALAVAAAPVDRADAVDWLERRLAPVPGRLHLVYHTVAWQYFPPEAQARGEALVAGAGGRATAAAPLARLAIEADGQGPGAGLWAELWPGGDRVSLGRVDFHGRWLDWRAPD
jgi:hypothetical protein